MIGRDGYLISEHQETNFWFVSSSLIEASVLKSSFLLHFIEALVLKSSFLVLKSSFVVHFTGSLVLKSSFLIHFIRSLVLKPLITRLTINKTSHSLPNTPKKYHLHIFAIHKYRKHLRIRYPYKTHQKNAHFSTLPIFIDVNILKASHSCCCYSYYYYTISIFFHHTTHTIFFINDPSLL